MNLPPRDIFSWEDGSSNDAIQRVYSFRWCDARRGAGKREAGRRQSHRWVPRNCDSTGEMEFWYFIWRAEASTNSREGETRSRVRHPRKQLDGFGKNWEWRHPPRKPLFSYVWNFVPRLRVAQNRLCRSSLISASPRMILLLLFYRVDRSAYTILSNIF